MSAPSRDAPPVPDAEEGARNRDAPATMMRLVDGVDVDAGTATPDVSATTLDATAATHGTGTALLAAGAAILDTGTAPTSAPPAAPPPILALIMAARGHNRPPGEPRKRRIVARFSRADILRIDALRAQLPRTSRAQLLRAFTLYTLAAFDPSSSRPAGEAPPLLM